MEQCKQIYDSIHSYIKITKVAKHIIDSKEFQRLRYLQQLGTCQYVFPNATHSRFEHSLGTYHLAGRMMEALYKNTPENTIEKILVTIPELEDIYLDRKRITELVKIAGLCHDLGHGPFSHTFDDVILLNYEHPAAIHEIRSCILLEKVIRQNNILSKFFKQNEIQFISNLINPKKEHIGFIYQIISNSFNNLDVDKFDYLSRDAYSLGLKYSFDFTRIIDDARVINNIICFPQQIYFEIASVFKTRYRLFRQIYNHKAVISIQFMISEIIELLDPILNIKASLDDMDAFCELTDQYIFSMLKYLKKNPIEEWKDNIEEAWVLWTKINERQIYKFIGSTLSKSGKIPEFDNINDDNIIIYWNKIGFVSGSKDNPLDNLYFFKIKDPSTCFKIDKEEITLLESENYQEYICMVYVKDTEKTDNLSTIMNILTRFRYD